MVSFKLQKLKIVEAGLQFKCEYTITHFNEEDGSIHYMTKHMVQDHIFNLYTLTEMFNKTGSHATEINNHSEETVAYPVELILDSYGGSSNKQYVIDIKYEFQGRSEEMSKGRTNKILVDEDVYKNASVLKRDIIELVTALEEFVVDGVRIIEETETIDFAKQSVDMQPEEV